MGRDEPPAERWPIRTEGDWTYRVGDGARGLAEERSTDSDLALTQSAESFVATTATMQNPMLTGKITVKGVRHLPRFGQLFPPPKADQPLPAVKEALPATA